MLSIRISRPQILMPGLCGLSSTRLYASAHMTDNMGSAASSSGLERLHFDNVVLRRLPLDTSQEPGSRTVRGACFSRVQTQPLLKPRFVAVSAPALSLLGLDAEEVLQDKLGAEYLSGSRLLPGSEPAAHCYCGHQFGHFAGQLGDGAACYLGEVRAPLNQSPELLRDNPAGRWEIQLKGAGLTPYSRQADGRKVLRSSVREFLCSEAMFWLGIPTTRAGSLVTSESRVLRDIYYSGQPRSERCSVVLRIAPTFIRFGSFEIFRPQDELTGRKGPSVNLSDLRAQLLDYVIDTFYPNIQQDHAEDRIKRNTAFFREVSERTARLVAQWQCVGFCHGVLNTDNMSVLGLTLDYGPFGFMNRFDPDFVCNASDTGGRYSYRAQPSVCRWNLVRLAEALGPELPPHLAEAVLNDFLPLYNAHYLGIMRRKLGLLRRESPEDEELVTLMLQTMHNTGADFTNTFRCLSQVPCPGVLAKGCDSGEPSDLGDHAVEMLLSHCASLEELRAAQRPTMDPRELAMIMTLAQSNPSLFQFLSDRKSVSQELQRLERFKELLEMSEEQLRERQREAWKCWLYKYRMRLALECKGESDLAELEAERVRVMNRTNPLIVLRNYIAQNAIEAAEIGDYSEIWKSSSGLMWSVT
ncbi:selenoprotein O1 isoform X2 [Amia ocellicauda]|uniref:selenoprotein O1 isoform X2 n=1 Tax=Amia ocellicauda TaxID=2972642 RepID=UPI0034639117